MSEALEFEAHHLQLGYVAGVHGVRGALRVKLFNPESSALVPGVSIVLREREGKATQTLEITRVAAKPGHDKMLRVWLAGIEDRGAAEQLRGHELWLDRADLPVLDEHEYYLADLVGLEVVRERDGALEPESLGRITGVTSNTAQDLLCVRLRGAEWLLPALPPFIVGIDEQRVIVDVHDDMLPESRERGPDDDESERST